MEHRYHTHAAQVFEDVASRCAARRALIWSVTDATSYEELDRLSNRMAHAMLDRGISKRMTVALCVEKHVTAFASLLACIKVGAPYFVIDPANPAARTRAMLETCRPSLAIVESSLDWGFDACPRLSVDAHSAAHLARPASWDARPTLAWAIDGSDPAYIMFTSGSTGTPKGVTISHSNLVNFIHWSRSEFRTTPDDVFTNVNPLYFDNSVFDIYSSLFAGAALVPFDAATMRDPAAVVRRIEQLECSVYFSVPSLLVYLQTMKLVTKTSFPALRKIVFGGEGYPKPMLSRLYEAVGDRIALYNVYGPTECTCICSVYRIGASDLTDHAGYAPLGSLIPNFSFVIVDPDLRPVPDGTAGELCLGGPCVGLGYYGDAGQSQKAFIQNPLHDRFHDRMYRTGDLVRRDPDDRKLYFVGRADTQIKHQGYRIELGEIEHALASVEGVDEAAAVYVTEGATGKIVAVVASRAPLAPAAVKQAVGRLLPRYMLPDRIVVVDELLKNANGKIDRRAIRASVEHAVR